MDDMNIGCEKQEANNCRRNSYSVDVGVHAEYYQRNILPQFTSAHLRQFVSPFYREMSLQTEDNLKKINKKVRKSKESILKKPKFSKKTQEKIEEIITRLCVPTQNSIVKYIKAVRIRKIYTPYFPP